VKQFEYTERMLDAETPIAHLNELGEQGWQCVSITPYEGSGVVILMREKRPPRGFAG